MKFIPKYFIFLEVSLNVFILISVSMSAILYRDLTDFHTDLIS